MSESRRYGDLEVRVHLDPAALALSAADEVEQGLRAAVARRGSANLMAATGNSQLALVEALTVRHAIPWEQVVLFHMDEYVGLGESHPASFRRWIRERIADRVRPGTTHYLDGTVDPTEECARYTALLASHPLDVCCLGLGENGHLAFNDPGVADFDDPERVKVVTLDETCRRQQVGEGHFSDVGSVPPTALTVTIPSLVNAARVVVVAPEARKAEPVRAALLEPISAQCPASVLRRHSNATLHLDEESASLL